MLLKPAIGGVAGVKLSLLLSFLGVSLLPKDLIFITYLECILHLDTEGKSTHWAYHDYCTARQCSPSRRKFMECSINVPALSLLKKHLVIGQR